MPRLLKELLAGVLPDAELRLVRAGLDIVGDVCIVQVPRELEGKEQAIAAALLQHVRHVRAVFKPLGPVSGEYRVRPLARLAGEGEAVTQHREHGCVYKVDLERAYFSPRLATERWRVAGLVQAGEVVVNLFGGVGPFSILMAKQQSTCTVYSVDSNPVAAALAAENVRLNRVASRVHVLQGDARLVGAERLRRIATRVLLPLPERAREFWDVALAALREEGGIVHYYTHVRAPRGSDPVQLAQAEVPHSRPRTIQFGRRVREVGPGWFEVVLDVAFGADRDTTQG